MKRRSAAPGGAVLLLSLLVAACGESDPVMVDVTGATSSLSITVEYLNATQPSGSADRLELAVGDSVLLSATGVNALGYALGQVAVTWSSSDASVMSVTTDGVLTAVAPGSAEITASVDEVSARLPGSVR